MSAKSNLFTTPDGRYIVVRARLWRAANPALSSEAHASLIAKLMRARRAMATARRAGDRSAETAAHAAVDQAKQALGERGLVWWSDGAPDLNWHMIRTTRYAAWFRMMGGNDDRQTTTWRCLGSGPCALM